MGAGFVFNLTSPNSHVR